MTAESRVAALGLHIPDFAATGYYGREYGSMKPHHITGRLLFLSGHVAQRSAEVVSGRLGASLSVADGYAAARLTGLNVLAGIRHAVGSLDRVSSIVRTLNFVVCAPECTDVNRVSSGLTDLLAEVFGEAAGLGGRATIGVMALAGGVCFETWATVELAE